MTVAAVLAALTGGAVALLTIVAIVLVVYGIVRLVRGDVAVGVALVIVGLLIGPGGLSIWG